MTNIKIIKLRGDNQRIPKDTTFFALGTNKQAWETSKEFVIFARTKIRAEKWLFSRFRYGCVYELEVEK